MARSSIGDRIIEARQKKGLSRNQFVDALGVTYTAAFNWEQKGMKPRPDMLAKIAKVLGVTERYLKGGLDSSSSEGSTRIVKILADARKQIADELGVQVHQVKVSMELVTD